MNKASSPRQKTNQKLELRVRPSQLLIAMIVMVVSLAGRSEVYAIDPSNTFYGTGALANATTGVADSAFGYNALKNDSSGSWNTASGAFALQLNTTGNGNAASGYHALSYNTTADGNTATGFQALTFNTTGNNNTASGGNALESNTTGNNNTANGSGALYSNTAGTYNAAEGFNALLHNTTGYYNAASGAQFNNRTGFDNTASGVNALYNNTTGSNNIAVGFSAGSALTTGNNNIEIGNIGVAGEVNTIRIGKVGTQQAVFIAGISGKTVAGGVGVVVDANGHFGTMTSSKRFKEDIKPMDKASKAILALKPVTFRYKKEVNSDGIPQFGLVAEQVEKVNP
jgi:hypothetical protein